MISCIEREMMQIDVHVIEEAGYESTRVGLGLSKKSGFAPHRLMKILAPMDGGHNKFLESMYVWVKVRAPRYWWSQADTYRLSSKQSESTMHTLIKELKSLGEAYGDTDFDEWRLDNIEDDNCDLKQLYRLQMAASEGDIVKVKQLLPEGFMQTRIWCMSYKTLRNIFLQRKKHKLPHWQEFIRLMKAQVMHPEFLP